MKIKTIAGMVVLGSIFSLIFIFRHDFVLASALLRDRITLALAAGILLLTLLHFGNEPLRWRALLKAFRPDLSLGRVYHTLTATSFFSYAIPVHFGMPIRLVMARKYLGMDFTSTGALLLIDSLVMYGTWCLAGAVGMSILLPSGSWGRPVAIVAVVLAGGGGVMVIAGYQGHFLNRYPRISDLVGCFSSALRMFSRKAAAGNAILIIGDIFIYGMRHMMILSSLGTDLPLLQITMVVAVSILAGFVSMMPMGLGGYDLSLVFLLMMIGVPRETALAVPVINRITMVSASALLGSISASRLGLSWGEMRSVGKEGAS